ncbi:MAG: pilus assembly protein TadG-related protein [Novosphingobium sp.]|uniref:pilus assembly protein TadG-related protein n=1 Tax=Novosphingobium sp. TaxID=1874826 RepID=UPI003B98F347
MPLLTRLIATLAKCRAGNILPLSALAIFAVAALIGGAVDISRGWRVQTRLQSACDAGVLAGRRAVTSNGFDATAREQAENYFYANFDEERQGSSGTIFTTTSADQGSTIDAVATTALPPLMMQLFGFSGFELRSTCTASMEVGNSDIMLVLDTTGSMAFTLAGSTQTRLDALRASVKNFYDTVAAAASGTSARIRYGFVPYSSTVNVGRLIYNRNPSYLVDSWTIQSRRAIRWANGTFKNWEYRPLVFDVSRYKTFAATNTNTGENGAAVSSTWGGCIEERSTVSEDAFTWSAQNGFSPTGAHDLDIDSAPDTTNATKWAPMWPEVAYIRTVTIKGTVYMTSANPSATGQQAFSACPSVARLLATKDRATFFSHVDELTPIGATYHDIGMVWGARLLSPDGIWSDNVREMPSNGGEVARHMIFMTDGEMSPSYSSQSAWGIEYHDRRVTDDGLTNDGSRHNSRFLALCEAVKAKGIRIWVIAFAASMTTELETCASTASSFTAENASELEDSFQSIAKQVGELRVVQ